MSTEASLSGRPKSMAEQSLETRAVHADEHLDHAQDVAPALHVSTTYKFARNAEDLVRVKDLDIETFGGFVYSRASAPNTTRFESVLSSILGGRSITYSTGLTALHAILVMLNPKRISIGEGYSGCHYVISVHSRLSGLAKLPLDCPAESLQEGDIIHLETPINPKGEALNIEAYAKKAHSRGAYLIVDSTLAPPPLQDPFKHGADLVMHSGTKYFGGHSDMLCGVLTVPDHRKDWWLKFWYDRFQLGLVMGNLEGWLGVRSLRTLLLRVKQQSQSAEKLVAWLKDLIEPSQESINSGNSVVTVEQKQTVNSVLTKVYHASLQDKSQQWINQQMPNGYGAVFSIEMKSETLARQLPSKLNLFTHATSLGGVESSVEWRNMTDDGVDGKLVRISVGVEGWEDLRDDLLQGFLYLAKDAAI